MKNYEKDKFNFEEIYFIKYKFRKMNKNIDISKIVDDIWVLKYWYLTIIEKTADSKNRINFDNIDLSESNKRSLEYFFKKKGFIGKFKLRWDSKKILYLNPIYSYEWKTVSKELFNAFNKVNKEEMY